jgi:hypothetical protein
MQTSPTLSGSIGIRVQSWLSYLVEMDYVVLLLQLCNLKLLFPIRTPLWATFNCRNTYSYCASPTPYTGRLSAGIALSIHCSNLLPPVQNPNSHSEPGTMQTAKSSSTMDEEQDLLKSMRRTRSSWTCLSIDQEPTSASAVDPLLQYRLLFFYPSSWIFTMDTKITIKSV